MKPDLLLIKPPIQQIPIIGRAQQWLNGNLVSFLPTGCNGACGCHLDLFVLNGDSEAEQPMLNLFGDNGHAQRRVWLPHSGFQREALWMPRWTGLSNIKEISKGTVDLSFGLLASKSTGFDLWVFPLWVPSLREGSKRFIAMNSIEDGSPTTSLFLIIGQKEYFDQTTCDRVRSSPRGRNDMVFSKYPTKLSPREWTFAIWLPFPLSLKRRSCHNNKGV